MAKLPQAGAEMVLETSKWDGSYDKVIADALKIQKETSDLSGTVDLKVSVDDTELKTAKGLQSDLDSTVSTKIESDNSELEEAAGIISGIKDTVLSISVLGGATVTGFGLLAGGTGLAGILEYDSALASIQGRTGEMIPDAQELISNLYVNGWGESRQQIADTIVAATNLGIAQEDLEEATLSAFQVASVSGDDTNEILRTMDSLVKNNLVSSYEEAADVITTGFQEGANRGEDLLDTFNEYGSTFGQLGISGEGALALINSGLAAGVDNSDRIADAVRETGIRLSEIGTDENIASAFTRLDELTDIDLAANLDAYNAGTMTGDEFYDGFFQAFEDAAAVAPVETDTLAATLIGTISEDFKIGAVSQLTTTWDSTLGTMEGRAQTAGNTISDTLGSDLTELQRTLQEAAVDFLSSDAIDLPGKIELIKTGISDALATLNSGGTISEAFTVGLKPIGFDDEFQKLEQIFGNLVINFLEIVASVQDLLGRDSSGTRGEIARLGAQQLAFDLKLANEDEVAGLLTTAMDRGVADSKIAGAVGAGVTELIDSGEIEKAQALITSLSEVGGAVLEVTDPVTRSLLEQQGLETTISIPVFPKTDPEAYREYVLQAQKDLEAQGIMTDVTFTDIDAEQIAQLQTQVDNAVITAQASVSRAAEDDIAATPGAIGAGGAQARAGEDDLSTRLVTAQEIADAASAIAGAAVDAQDAMAAAASGAALSNQDFVNAVAQMQAEATGMDIAITDNAESAGTAMTDLGATITHVTSGNTITEDFALIKTTADENFPIVIAYLETLEAAFTEMGGAASVAGIQASSAIAGIGGAAGGAGNPFDAAPDPNYHGGTFGAGEPLLFEGAGKEVVAFNTPGNVFGVQETAAMMEGLSSMNGGAGGTTINNYNVNVSQNITNMAQAVGSANAIAKATRGMS